MRWAMALSAFPYPVSLRFVHQGLLFIRVVPALPFKEDSYSLLQVIAKIFKVFHADYVVVDKRNDYTVLCCVCEGALSV